MRGVGRIHVGVNIPAFTTFTLTDLGSGSVRVTWVAVRATTVDITGPTGGALVTGGAVSGTVDFSYVSLVGYGVSAIVTGAAIDHAGGRGAGSASITITPPTSPAFSSSSATPVASPSKNITIAWATTNATSVTVYLCDSNYNIVSTLTTGGASGPYVYTAPSYNSIHYFRLRANGNASAVPSSVDVGAFATSSSAPASVTTTFTYTGGSQTYTVPAGCYQVTTSCWGGHSADLTSASMHVQDVYGPPPYDYLYTYPGSSGGYVTCTHPVTPGEVLTVKVGGQGTTSAAGYNNVSVAEGGGGLGSSTGGGTTGAGPVYGGGASGVYRGSTKLVVAGGGGGRAPEIFVDYSVDYLGNMAYAPAGGLGGGAQSYPGNPILNGSTGEINANTTYWPSATVFSSGGNGGAGYAITDNCWGQAGGISYPPTAAKVTIQTIYS